MKVLLIGSRMHDAIAAMAMIATWLESDCSSARSCADGHENQVLDLVPQRLEPSWILGVRLDGNPISPGWDPHRTF